jgi:hypothetical protein
MPHNENGVFQLKGVVGQHCWTLKDFVGFMCLTFDVGQRDIDVLSLTNDDLKPCLYQILMSMGGLESA